jgi:DNA-binding transcriptional LysR family regulator
VALRTFYRNEISLTRAGSDEVARIGIQPRLSTDGLYALRTAAVEGLGLAVGSAWAMEEELRAGRLLHIVPQWLADPLPVHLVYPQARLHPARLRSFIDIMRVSGPAALNRLQGEISVNRP